MSHVLYRFYSATGQLLYVGITANPPTRFKAHRHTKDWWSEVVGITLENYATREDLANAERRAIQVERPLHNVVHAKRPGPARALRTPDAPLPTDAPVPNADYANLFDSPSINELLPGLFGRTRRETRYGYVTDEEYERRAEQDRAKAEAREQCPLCDSDGYRNMRVCNHIDYGDTSPYREARKRQLQIIEGGDA